MTRRSREGLPAGLFSGRRRDKAVAFGGDNGQQGTLIASYNVHKCVGMDKRFDPDRVAAVIAEIDAEVIALQEANQRFGERALLLDCKRLERDCGLVPVPFVSGNVWHGNLLLLRSGAVRDVHQIRLPGVEPRGALVVDVDLEGGPLRIVAAHLGLLRRSRARQAEAILAAVAARSERPTLLLGDLNEWRVGGNSSLRRLDPAFGPLSAALPSFPSNFPVFALDRILAKPHNLISRIDVHDTPLARMASDHLPIKARVTLAAPAALPAGDGKLAA